MKKDLLGVSVEIKPHKLVDEIVSFMLKHKDPISTDEIEKHLLQTNTPHNLKSRINRSLNNTPELVKDNPSDQSRIFSIELQYENIKVIEKRGKYSLKLVSDSKPVVRTSDFTNDDLIEYTNRKNKVMNSELYELKEKFLSEWPIERLKVMDLNEYTNLEKTSFCYWLEHITRDIGSIVGGSSYKFGIYERSGNSEVKEESNRTTDGDYAWFKKYGLSRDEAFESIREILLKIANSAKNNELSNIESIDLGFAYKWKIAFLYGDYNILNIFKEKVIRKIANELEIDESQVPLYQLHSEILNKKLKEEDYYDFTKKYWRLINDDPFSDTKLLFKKYLINIHKLKNESTAKAYVTNLGKVQTWFKEHELASDSYNIWDVNNDNYSIDNILKSSFKQKWHELNQHKNGWYGTPWNRWLEFIEWSIKEDGKEEVMEIKNDNTDAVNMILYGPPGTGKTYNTINKAVKIASPDFDLNQSRESIKKEYKRLVEQGQIAFTTFHQSMSYEEFIEGIKPITDNGEVTYEVQDGIFKDLCIKAKGISGSKSTIGEFDFENVSYFKMSLGGKNRKNIHNWCLQNNFIALGWGGDNDYSNLVGVEDWNTFRDIYKSNYPELVEESKFHIQAVYCFTNWMKKGDIVLVSLGNKVIDAIGVIEGDYEYVSNPEYPYHHQRKVRWLSLDMDSSPKLFVDKNISQQTIYKFDTDDIKIDAFKNQFTNEISSKANNYVMIIDEINRGNVSSIFGELITLIELDKRNGTENEITLTLPYSKEAFSVPNNVSIIGTMNTADRSVEALDTALRRRFSFVEMMPDYEVISNLSIDKISLKEVLKTINDRVELLVDRDHTIGHSYFIDIDTKEKLSDAFNDKIIPLLQEYFYGDYGKIGLVLGEGFVKKETKDIAFASFKYDDSDDFKTPKYNLIKVNEGTIMDAIKTLLGKVEDSSEE
jgi:5-methylcytosine-specific restriction protein B